MNAQMKEYEWVNATARYSPRKVSMFGDLEQLPPNDSAQSESEFRSTSVMQRLINNGFTSFLLEEQYRMHPEIAQFVSNSFYDSTLIDHPSTMSRPSDYKFAQFSRQHLGRTG